MFKKLAILTVALVALSGGLLVLRQQRLEVANQNAALYWKIQRSRQNIWAAQARTAVLLRPKDLQQRIERTGLGLEAYDPSRTRPLRGWAQAPGDASHTEAIR